MFFNLGLPRVAVSGKRIENRIEPGTRLIFTIGYEGRNLDDFSKELAANGIKRLIDVREIAWSRKPGFSSKRLSEGLSGSGIEYMHLRALGSPKALREELKQTDDFDKFADAYKMYLGAQKESLDLLSNCAIEKPTAIMCFERDPMRCHRSVIASELGELGFAIRDL